MHAASAHRLLRLDGFLCGALGILVAACQPAVEPAQADTESAETEGSERFVFVDVAEAAGLDMVNASGDARRWYIPEGNGCGAAWLDHDGDGDLDLFLANGAGMRYIDDGARLEVDLAAGGARLYENKGGMRFEDVSRSAGLDVAAWINASAVGDVDGDGDPDLYLACFGDDLFFRNDGGHFVECSRAVGLVNELWGAGAAFGDVDNDGDLDLYVANYCLFDLESPPDGGRRAVLEGVEIGWGPEQENGQGFNRGAPDRFFLNDGSAHFREASADLGLELDAGLCSYAVVFSDVDGDGWQDILVANDLQPCNLFHNDGHGTFEEQGMQRGFALNADGQATAAMGLFVADVDADGDMDVLRTNFDFEANSLHINDGHGHFQDRASAFGLAAPSIDHLGWGGGFFDADCDGDLDLLIANGHVMPQAEQIGMHAWAQRSQFFEGQRDGAGRQSFVQRAPAGQGLDLLRSARGVAFADADQDGDLDALIVDLDQRPRLLENRTPSRGNWLRIRTVGTLSNRDGLGARVRVIAGDRTWTDEVRFSNGLYSSHAPELFVGLGPAPAVDRVEIRWPSGHEQVVLSPQLNATLVITESEPR
ncbi:MAG: hypothetical protein ACI8QZ_000505 [Chlamydiales bacterium]|jgi:hypothetical protein